MTTSVISGLFEVGAAANDTVVSDDLGVTDMTLVCTVESWNTGDACFFAFFGRSDLDNHEYTLLIETESEPNATWSFHTGDRFGAELVSISAASPAEGDTITFDITGETLTASLNSTTVLTLTDATFTTGGFAGAEMQNAVGISNFRAVYAPFVITFEPRTQLLVPPVFPKGDPQQTSLGYRLFRHYRSRPQGISVFIYSDDSVSEDPPDGDTTFWAPDDRQSHQNGPVITRAFYGGHTFTDLTEEEAALLEAEGYTVTVS